MLLLALCLSLAQAAAPPPGLAGTWKLDAARSSDARPLLQRLGVPGFLAAASGAVTQVITLGPESLTVVTKTAVKNSTETVSLASGSESRDALFGAAYVVRARVEGASVIATGTIQISGVQTPLTIQRRVDGETMHLVATIGTGADATALDRVFVRAD